eukprot:5808594-Ditylum_brightwellii.AAC.1
MSATVLVVQQNHTILSMYPIGTEKWKPTSVLVLEECWGTIKASLGMLPGLSQMRMYASTRLSLLMNTGLKAGSVQTMCWRIHWKVHPNWIALGGAVVRMDRLRLLHV